MKVLNPRTHAVLTLQHVFERGLSLNEAIAKTGINLLPEKALIKELCYGTLRWYLRLEFMAKQLLQKPFKNKDQDIFILLCIGLYQLFFMRIPPHAAVTETVNVSRELNKPWASGLINAVLRNAQRQQTQIKDKIEQNSAAIYAHPEWLLSRLQKAYPTNWQKIITANNTHAPLSLRVNCLRQTREEYLHRLIASGLDGIPHEQNDTGIMLKNPVDIEKLPGFKNGDVSVQDAASQMAAPLLMLAPHQRVLDACCAPGGKTAHILECEPLLEKLTAIDHDAYRLLKVTENLERLHLAAEIICADAQQPETWWDGNSFDSILLDAPCSATGVIRRHPDIKILRRESDIATLAKTQLQLLNTLWSLLKPQGLLLYSTCSLFPEENESVLNSFLQTHQDAKEIPINATWGEARSIGRQLFPTENGHDGFYYARLEKLK